MTYFWVRTHGLRIAGIIGKPTYPIFVIKEKIIFPKPSQVHTKFYILFDIATSELHVLEVKISQAQDTNDQK